MSDHEQRWRDAMSSDLAAYHDDDGINNVRCGDIRALLADLATARAEKDALWDALEVIANRECADEEDAAGVAYRCLLQINAALREPRT